MAIIAPSSFRSSSWGTFIGYRDNPSTLIDYYIIYILYTDRQVYELLIGLIFANLPLLSGIEKIRKMIDLSSLNRMIDRRNRFLKIIYNLIIILIFDVLNSIISKY